MIPLVTIDVVGVAELAARWGISKQAVSNWRRRGLLPPPDAVIESGPVWERSTIAAWEQSRQADDKVIPGQEPRRRRTT